MPPRDAYGDPSSSPSQYPNPHGQGGGGPGRVEQRRHADGSMSISIGGGAGGEGGQSEGPPGGPGGEPNISDVSHLLLYDNGEGVEGQQNPNDEGK